MIFLGTSEWDELVASGATVDQAVLAARSAELQFDDPINIQYTSGTTGFPKGATLSHHNILNNGYFVGEGCRYDERDRVCIPVPFYHCFGMVMGNLGCTTHGATMVVPAPGVRPRGHAARRCEAERCTSLYGVPTMFIAELGHPDFHRFDLSSLRTGIMAGSPCPVEVMKQCVSAMHMDEVTICYGMTETSPVSTQTAARRPARQAGRHRRPGAPPRRGQGRRPRHRARRAPRRVGRALHARLLGDARLLGRAGEDGRRDRRRRLDAHRGPGDDGRRRLREHRRAHQGHDHPGRRERVPARDRGVPVHPSRHRRRAGRRRARRPLRRGGHGLGQGARRRRPDHRVGAGVLPGSDRALQGAALRPGDRGVPDDRDGQGPEVQDARSRHRAPRPAGRGPHRDGRVGAEASA